MRRKTIDVTIVPGAYDLPYSSAVAARGDLIFTSGHVGFDPQTGDPPAGIEAQTEQSLENLKAVLEASGSALKHAVKVNVYLTDAANYEAMNAVYRRYFPEERPARTTVVTNLVRSDLLIEIEIVALAPGEADN